MRTTENWFLLSASLCSDSQLSKISVASYFTKIVYTSLTSFGPTLVRRHCAWHTPTAAAAVRIVSWETKGGVRIVHSVHEPTASAIDRAFTRLPLLITQHYLFIVRSIGKFMCHVHAQWATPVARRRFLRKRSDFCLPDGHPSAPGWR